jgi:hypothetical protein
MAMEKLRPTTCDDLPRFIMEMPKEGLAVLGEFLMRVKIRGNHENIIRAWMSRRICLQTLDLEKFGIHVVADLRNQWTEADYEAYENGQAVSRLT